MRSEAGRYSGPPFHLSLLIRVLFVCSANILHATVEPAAKGVLVFWRADRTGNPGVTQRKRRITASNWTNSNIVERNEKNSYGASAYRARATDFRSLKEVRIELFNVRFRVSAAEIPRDFRCLRYDFRPHPSSGAGFYLICDNIRVC